MRSARRMLMATALALLGACGDSGGGGDGGGGSSVAGVWQYISGPAFRTGDFTDDGFLSATPRYLVLEAGGGVTLVQQEETSQVLFCNPGIFTTTSRSLFLQFDLLFSRPALVFLREQPAVNVLELTDSGGSVSTFIRVGFLPAEFQCRPLTVRATHPGISEVPDSSSGLAWDGTSLFFTSRDGGVFPTSGVFPIDRSGVLGAPLPFFGFDQYQLVHAAQGTDLWVHCGCGAGEETQRKTQAGAVVDVVNTLGDLGEEMNIGGIAYDSVGAILWIQGFSFSLQAGRIMKVSSDAEPDVLLQTLDFDVSLRSMTWDGTWLWAITSEQNVVQIDPAALTAVATFDSPDRSIRWTGIASAPATVGPGNSLYLIGEDRAADEGVLVEVQP